MTKIADYARATSAAAAAAAAAACVRVCSVLYGSHAKAVNPRHRGALCSVCVGRPVRCVARPHAPEPRAHYQYFLSLTAAIEHPRRMQQ